MFSFKNDNRLYVTFDFLWYISNMCMNGSIFTAKHCRVFDLYLNIYQPLREE